MNTVWSSWELFHTAKIWQPQSHSLSFIRTWLHHTWRVVYLWDSKPTPLTIKGVRSQNMTFNQMGYGLQMFWFFSHEDMDWNPEMGVLGWLHHHGNHRKLHLLARLMDSISLLLGTQYQRQKKGKIKCLDQLWFASLNNLVFPLTWLPVLLCPENRSRCNFQKVTLAFALC